LIFVKKLFKIFLKKFKILIALTLHQKKATHHGAKMNLSFNSETKNSQNNRKNNFLKNDNKPKNKPKWKLEFCIFGFE
jgi:hypothetical protein